MSKGDLILIDRACVSLVSNARLVMAKIYEHQLCRGWGKRRRKQRTEGWGRGDENHLRTSSEIVLLYCGMKDAGGALVFENGSGPRIFFTGRFTYRKPQALFGASVGLLFGGAMLLYLIFSLRYLTLSWNPVLPVLFILGIGGLLIGTGVLLLKNWCTRTSMALEISEAGIKYGKNLDQWDSIQRLGASPAGARVHLFYQLRGQRFSSHDHMLIIDESPTVQQYDNLIESLRDALHEKHPHVVFD